MVVNGKRWRAYVALEVQRERNGISARLVDREKGNIFGRWQPLSQPNTEEDAIRVLLEELNRRLRAPNGRITELELYRTLTTGYVLNFSQRTVQTLTSPREVSAPPFRSQSPAWPQSRVY